MIHYNQTDLHYNQSDTAYNLNQQQPQIHTNNMNNKNAKVYKFPRRQMQVSEEINNKKTSKQAEKPRESKKMQVASKEEARDKPNAAFLKELEEQSEKDEGANLQKNAKASKSSGDIEYKSEELVRMSEKGVLFEKKLTKIIMPEQYQRYKYINKLENKLLNCLQKKKPLIPMKKLVHVEMLNDILNKKERKIITNRPNFIEKLDVEAQSLRKIQEKTQSSGEEKLQQKQQVKQGDQKFKLKLLPLRVPTYNQEEQFFRAQQTSNFIFEQADSDQFGFFNEQTSSFDNIQGFQPHFAKNVFQQEEKPNNLFKKINNNTQNSIFSQMDEYSFNKSLFNQQRQIKNNPKTYDIGKIKIPKAQNRNIKVKNKPKTSEFNIFSIEEQQTIFFNEQNEIYEDGNQQDIHKNEKYWDANDYGSEYSYASNLYY